MKIIILGAKGVVGYELSSLFSRTDGYHTIPFGRDEIDITNLMQVKQTLFKHQPDIIINAAGFTNVEACEDEKDKANLVNGEAVKFLAEAAVDTNAVLIHYSTDYVFDGQETAGYPEYYPRLRPINAYGYSKAIGETSISKIQKIFADTKPLKYYLIRTSWVFGENGKNFVDTMLNLSKKQQEIPVVSDQVGCPTYAPDLAKRTMEIIRNKSPYGIYHVTNDGKCSWYDFARKIFDITNRQHVNIRPISSDEYPFKAKRPLNSVLLNSKLPPLRTWEQALGAYLSESKKLKKLGLL